MCVLSVNIYLEKLPIMFEINSQCSYNYYFKSEIFLFILDSAFLKNSEVTEEYLSKFYSNLMPD